MLSERKGIEHDAARGVLLPFRYRGARMSPQNPRLQPRAFTNA